MKKLLAPILFATLSMTALANNHGHQHHNDKGDHAFSGLGGGLFVSNTLGGTLTPMVSYRMPWVVAGLGLSLSFSSNSGALKIPLYAGVNMEVCKSFDFQAGLSADLNFGFGGASSWQGGIGAFVGGELDLWKHLALTAQVLPYYYSAGGQHSFFSQVRVGVSYVL